MATLRDYELAVNRKLTKWFIDRDPTSLILIPRVPQDRHGGSHRWVDGTPKNSQIFKIIYSGTDGIVVTSDGKTRRFDFVIVGEYDANIQIGDHWAEGDQQYVIEYLFPFNNYEIKGGGVTHGSKPAHG